MREQLDRVLDLLAENGAQAAKTWLAEALGRLPGDASLEALQRVLDREATALAGWKPADEPSFALQQIRNRAVACGFADLAAEAERRFEAAGLAWFEDLLASVPDNPALVRRLPGGTGERQPPLTSDGRATINRPPGLVEIRDVRTGALITSRAAGNGRLLAGSGGCVLIEESDRKNFRLRNLANDQLVANIARPEISRFVFSRDGWMFSFGTQTSTGFDGEYFSSFDVEVWDVRQGRAVWAIKGSDERSGGLTALAISPDNRHAAVIGCSNLYLRRITDEATIGTWPSASILHSDLAFTPDGRHLVMNDRKAIRVISVESGNMRSIDAGGEYIQVMALSSDGTRIAGTGGGRLRLWNLADGRQLWEQRIPDQFNQPVWFLSEAGPLAVSVSTGRLALFDMADGKSLCCFDAHPGSIDSVAASPDGRHLVTSGAGEVKVWNMALLVSAGAPPKSAFEAFRVLVSPDGNRAVLQSKTGVNVVRLDNIPYSILWESASIPSFNGASLSPDGGWLLCSSSDGTARRYPVDGGEPAMRPEFGWRLSSLAWSPCGTWIVAVLDSGAFIEIRKADPGPGIATDEEPWRLEFGKYERMRDVAFSRDGSLLAVLDEKNVQVLVPAERRIAATVRCSADRVAISDDGFLLTTKAHHFGVQVWNWSTGERLAEGRAEGYNGAALSPDGVWAVTGSDRLKVEARLPGQALIETIGEIAGTVEDTVERQRLGAVFVPDGRHALTVMGEAGLGLWRLPDCRLIARFRGFEPFSCLASSRDGRTVVANDKRLRAWFLRLRGPLPPNNQSV